MRFSDIPPLIFLALIIGVLFFLSQERILPEYYQYIYPSQVYASASSSGTDINHVDGKINPQTDNLRLGVRSVDIEPDLEKAIQEDEDRWEEFEDSSDKQERLLEDTLNK